MRSRIHMLIYGLMLGMAPATADAATVIWGIVHPNDGIANLTYGGQPWPSDLVPAGKRVTISFALEEGAIIGALSMLQYRWAYGIVPSDPNAIPYGNDIDGNEICSFNGAGPNGCFDDSGSEAGVHPSRLMTNLVVGPQQLSYDVFRPASFDRCGQGLFDVVCSSSWTISNEFSFTVAATKPITFRLSVSDPVAVPEPSSWAMMILGFGALGVAQRRSMRMRAPVQASSGYAGSLT